MADRKLPSEKLAESLIALLGDAPLAADERELSRLVCPPLHKQFAVAVLINAEDIETVQGALDSMAEWEVAKRGRWRGGRGSGCLEIPKRHR